MVKLGFVDRFRVKPQLRFVAPPRGQKVPRGLAFSVDRGAATQVVLGSTATGWTRDRKFRGTAEGVTSYK